MDEARARALLAAAALTGPRRAARSRGRRTARPGRERGLRAARRRAHARRSAWSSRSAGTPRTTRSCWSAPSAKWPSPPGSPRPAVPAVRAAEPKPRLVDGPPGDGVAPAARRRTPGRGRPIWPTLLRLVHALPAPGFPLPRRELLGGVERWLQLAGDAIDPADAAYLRARRDGFAAAAAALTPHLPPGPIHGDALPRNVHIGPEGPVLVDLETFSSDFREHDLVVMALSRDRYGLPAEQYDAFVTAYGWDVREWEGCAVLRGARETASCAWVAQHAPTNPKALDEFRRRVASLRGRRPRGALVSVLTRPAAARPGDGVKRRSGTLQPRARGASLAQRPGAVDHRVGGAVLRAGTAGSRPPTRAYHWIWRSCSSAGSSARHLGVALGYRHGHPDRGQRVRRPRRAPPPGPRRTRRTPPPGSACPCGSGPRSGRSCTGSMTGPIVAPPSRSPSGGSRWRRQFGGEQRQVEGAL